MSEAQTSSAFSANQVVASNLRAEMSRERWTGRKAAVALGVTQPYVGRRMSGVTPLDANDMVMFAGLLKIPVARLLEGMEMAPTGGAVRAKLPELDSNQQPADLESARQRRGERLAKTSETLAIVTPLKRVV